MSERAKIRDFLSQRIRGHELKDDDDIFGLGFINSLFALQLVMFVEKEFNLVVEDEDMDITNFTSVDAIAALVARKGAPVQSRPTADGAEGGAGQSN